MQESVDDQKIVFQFELEICVSNAFVYLNAFLQVGEGFGQHHHADVFGAECYLDPDPKGVGFGIVREVRT